MDIYLNITIRDLLMRIIKLVLHKYDRFVLNNITTLTYTPKSKIQIIAGTNGSGKSSLLYELSPLPGNIKKDYVEGGYKEIHILHKNKSYVLINGKEGSLKNSFVVNGIELNDGKTRKVQLILCKQHFGITPEIHEILISSRNLTTMSITDRKRWLSELSSIDYTYSIGIFNKLKSRHRDVIGGLKLLNTKISTLESKTLDDVVLRNYIDEHEYIQNIIYDIIERKESVSIKEVNTNDIESLSNSLQRMLLRMQPVATYRTTPIDSLKARKIVLEEHVETLIDKIENNKEIEIPTSSNEVKAIIDKLNTELSSMEDSFDLDIDINNLDNVIYTFNNNYMQYIDLLNRLAKYTDIDNSPDRIDSLKYLLTHHGSKYKVHEYTLEGMSTEFNLLEANRELDAIECVKCNHTWKQGYNEDRYNTLTRDISNLTGSMTALSGSIGSVQTILGDIEDYAKLYSEYIKFIETDKDIFKLITNIQSKLTMPSDVNKLLDELYSLKNTLFSFSTYNTKKNELKNLNERYKLIVENERIVKTISTESVEQLNNKLNQLYNEQFDINRQIDTHDKYILLMSKIKETKALLKVSIVESKNRITNNIKNNNNTYYNNVITYSKTLLTDLEKMISEAKYSNMVLTNLKKEEVELLNIKTSLEFGLKALSPTEGLIAKSILSFIGVFTENINNIINSIWTYKMELISPSIGLDNDLDYKFKVRIDDNDNPREDISKVSSGMAEVINLSHKIVAGRLLGLDNYPLYLDEYGSKFDPLHKDKAYVIAKELSEDHSQIFMVTHFQETYDIYPKSELVILSSDNLFMSDIKEFNTSIEIK